MKKAENVDQTSRSKHPQNPTRNSIFIDNENLPEDFQTKFVSDEIFAHEIYSQLSPEAQEIIKTSHLQSDLRVNAGPGSGKTLNLVIHVLNLLFLKRLEPREIVIITFTQKAAENLKSQVVYWLKQFKRLDILPTLHQMFIGTIHSYCFQLLQDHFGFGNFIPIEDTVEKAFIMKHEFALGLNAKKEHESSGFQLFGDFKIGLDDNSVQNQRKFLRTFEIFLNENVNRDQLKRNQPRLYYTIQVYEKLLKSHKLMTYGQIIRNAVHLLKTDSFPVQDLRYLLVDEFQDINRAQEQLIKRICEKAMLFAVGDPAQSIYGWRGASIQIFSDFSQINPSHSSEYRSIPQNYRSYPPLVRIADKFKKDMKISQFTDPMISMRQDFEGFVGKITFASKSEEAKYIISQIKQFVGAGYGIYGDYAILLRSVARNGLTFIEECKRQKVPYILGGKVGLFNRPEIQAVTLSFAWLFKRPLMINEKNYTLEYLLQKAINLWKKAFDLNDMKNPETSSKYTDSDVEEILQQWKTRSVRIISKLNQELTIHNKISLERTDFGENPANFELHESKEKSFEASETPIPKYIQEHSAYLNGTTYLDLFNSLLQKFGSYNWDIKNPLESTFMANLGKFSQILNDFEFTHKMKGSSFSLMDYLEKFCQFIDNHRNDFSEATPEDETFSDAVNIFTIHQAKGLEWPFVSIPCVVQNDFPDPKIEKLPKTFFKVSESPNDAFPYPYPLYISSKKTEARLAYVAFTRARSMVCISEYQKINREKNIVSSSPLYTALDDPAIHYLTPSESLVSHPKFIPDTLKMKKTDDTPNEEFTITEILDYEKCPMLYFFRHVLKWSPILNRFLGYGHNVHHIIRRLTEIENLDLTDGIAVSASLARLLDQDFNLLYLNKKSNNKLKGGVKRMITQYVSKYGDELNRMQSVETRIELHRQKATLKGVADIILEDPSPANPSRQDLDPKKMEPISPSIHIRDYKTRRQGILEIHKLQIWLYAACFREMGYNPTSGSIAFLTTAENERIPVTAHEIAQALDKADELIKHIQNREFEVNTSALYCETQECDFCAHCRYYNARHGNQSPNN